MSTALALVATAFAVWLVMPSHRVARLHHLSVERDVPASMHGGFRAPWRGRQRDDSDLVMARTLRALAAELRAGSLPSKALEAAGGDPSLWPRAVIAARFGESVEGGLARDAEANPEHGRLLRQLAACWQVGVAHGSGLAGTVERLALSARAEHELQSTLRGELASSRATVRLLALLPLVGIAMGYLLGADPIGWFLGSPIGFVLLIVAVALTSVGVWWTRRIVRRIEHVL